MRQKAVLQWNSDMLQAALAELNVGVALFCNQGYLIFCNDAFKAFYPSLSAQLRPGCSVDTLSQLALQKNQVSPSNDDESAEAWLLAPSDGVSRCQQTREGRSLEVHYRLLEPWGWLLSVSDISQQKQFEDKLHHSEEAFHSVVAQNSAGILVVDQQGVVQFSNHAAQILLRRSAETLQGEHLGLPLSTGKMTEIDIVLPKGGSGVAEMSVTDSVWAERPAQIVMLYDITARKRAEQSVEHIAYHDTLTGLPNRRLLLDRLQHALTRADREHDQLALLFLDLDGFKAVNDHFGHDAGDELLCQVARRLSDCLREMDTVARLGGDEFVVLSEHIASADVVYELAERLRSALNRPFIIDDHQVSVSTSVGVSVYPSDSDEAETLLRCADIAMYQAKSQGKNQVRFYERKSSSVPTLMDPIQALRQALEKTEFKVYYQPQVAIDSDQIVGLEALLRWQHPTKGVINADNFLGALEETSLIDVVTDWVLRSVCQQINHWKSCGLTPPPVAINLSRATLASERALKAIDKTLHEIANDVENVLFELSEQALLEHITLVEGSLYAWTALGVDIALDDFGAAQTSISTLQRLPISQLKLSRLLLEKVPHNQGNNAVIAAIVAMAKTLQLDVVAQGVERAEQRTFLAELGCPIVQGWLIEEPLPALKIEQRLV